MDIKNVNELAGDMFRKKEVIEHFEFMYNPDNIGNCANCPNNIGHDGENPCGQSKCWVECHCGM